MSVLRLCPVTVSGLLVIYVRADGVVLPPEISESTEAESGNAEQILHTPDSRELERNLALEFAAVSVLRAVIVDGLVKGLEIQCVLEILAVKEPVNTEKESVVDGVAVVRAAVVLDVEAERSKFCVLPEVEATRDLEVGPAWSVNLVILVLLRGL